MENKKYLKNGLLSLLMLGILGFSGCKKYRTEYSEVMHEEAIVSKKVHSASWRQPIPIKVGKITTYHFRIHPAKYDITFDGEIDFIVDNKDIFDRFNEKDSADLSYEEVYRVTYEDKNEKAKALERKIIDYKFLDAVPKK